MEDLNLVRQTTPVLEKLLHSTFVELPKKSRATKCDNYRIINLMSYMLKMLII